MGFLMDDTQTVPAPPAQSPAPEPTEPGDDEVTPGQTDRVDQESKTAPVPMSRKQRDAVERKALIDKIGQAADDSAKASAALAEEREHRIRIEARLEEMSRQPAPRQQQTQTAADEDDDLPAETRVKLSAMEQDMWAKVRAGDANALTNFQVKSAAMISRALNAKAEAARPAPATVYPPEIAALRQKHIDVLAHPAGETFLRAFDAELGASGMPNGFARTQKAYEKASQHLGLSKAATPTKAQEAALGGAGKGGGGSRSGGGQKVNLPEGMTMREVREISKASGISPERYLARYAKLYPDEVSSDD